MNRRKTVLITASCAVIAMILGALLAVILVNLAKHNPSADGSSSAGSMLSDTVSALAVINPTSDAPKEIVLSFSSPQEDSVTTIEPTFTFIGSSDPNEPLLLNGNTVDRNPDGSFAVTCDLKVGKNTFTFTHKGETVVKNIRYRYVIIQSYSPSAKQTYESGATFSVIVKARAGSSVAAEFNGKTIQLTRVKLKEDDPEPQSDTFADFVGQFTLPSGNTTDLSPGKVWMSATYNNQTETVSSGNIICKKAKITVKPDDTIPQNNKNYNNVGAGYIAEIVGYTAETFTTSDPNLWCLPTNNYLPQGTVDYCSPSFYHEKQSNGDELLYVALRCGRSVLLEKNDLTGKNHSVVTQCYEGSLPDHNEVHIADLSVSDHHSVLTLGTLWKAPFYFELKEQGFANPAKQDYTFSNTTFSYVDITFCYATVLDGELNIPADHPLFASAEVIRNNGDITLRLHLKKTGGFYGWDSYYNADGQLCFRFLNPTPATSSGNRYGADLTGITVLLDVGHGGIDIGASGFDSVLHNEAVQNLHLANLVRRELESIGAAVVMNRTDSGTTVTQKSRCEQVKNLAPDLVLAIHHNSNYSSSPNGFDAYYYAPFSKKAAESVYGATKNSGLYQNYGLQWHAYYTGRMSMCPVVLTENGYISNWNDYTKIVDATSNSIKAQALTQGIANYFLSLN